MRKVFLTGATGVMGAAAMREITSDSNAGRYRLTVLARDTKVNRRKLSPFIDRGVRVIWGDLLNPDDLRRGISDADVVLHVGGMVSPKADYFPKKTVATNVGSMENIVAAIRDEESKGRNVRLVYIGSVSQYGDRLPPHHIGRAGDFLSTSLMDHYAFSKVKAEMVMAESGLKNWVSLRLGSILHVDLLKKSDDPIMFHVPLRGVLEWVSDEDCGRLLERVCRPEVPDTFWRKYYNIGGGEPYRMTNYEFERITLTSLGCPPPEKIFDAQWFAAKNFHGMWFSDSDALDEILHFRRSEAPEAYLQRKKALIPWYFKLAGMVPSFIMKQYLRTVAHKKPFGTLCWLKNGDEARIRAFFGSREQWKEMPGWEDKSVMAPRDKSVGAPVSGADKLNEKETFSEEQLKAVALRHGGEYLGVAEGFDAGDPNAPHIWRCSCGHEFRLRPATVVNGGHWCISCLENRLH